VKKPRRSNSPLFFADTCTDTLCQTSRRTFDSSRVVSYTPALVVEHKHQSHTRFPRALELGPWGALHDAHPTAAHAELTGTAVAIVARRRLSRLAGNAVRRPSGRLGRARRSSAKLGRTRLFHRWLAATHLRRLARCTRENWSAFILPSRKGWWR